MWLKSRAESYEENTSEDSVILKAIEHQRKLKEEASKKKTTKKTTIKKTVKKPTPKKETHQTRRTAKYAKKKEK